MSKTLIAALLLAGGSIAPAEAWAQASISWSTLARSYRGSSDALTLRCPPGGRPGQVWGTDIYTDDSSICTAAVHAGLITFMTGGTIVLATKPGRSSYTGSRRNGVVSESWGRYDASFSVTAWVEPPPPEPPKPPPPPPTIPWDRTAERLAPNGREFTFICPPGGVAAPVKGTDLYSSDSSICTAAVHSGAIDLEAGGTVTIAMRPGAAAYTGSGRNGVTSTAGGRTVLGFVIIDDRGRELHEHAAAAAGHPPMHASVR